MPFESDELDVTNQAFLRQVSHGDLLNMRRCLEEGADVNAKGGEALRKFVEEENLSALKILFDFEVDVHLNNGQEFLAAVKSNSRHVVHMMLERDPSLMCYEKDALMIAAMCPYPFPNVLSTMLEKHTFSGQALNYALVFAAHANIPENADLLCRHDAKLSAREISDMHSALIRNHWSPRVLSTMALYPQNIDMLYLSAALFDRKDIERLPAVGRVRAFDAMLKLEDTLREAPNYMRPAISLLASRFANEQGNLGKATFRDLPKKRAEALRGLFNWVGEENGEMRNAILQAVRFESESPTKKFVGIDTADPFALEY